MNNVNRPDMVGIYKFVETILQKLSTDSGNVEDVRKEAIKEVLTNTKFLGEMLKVSNKLAEEQTRALKEAGHVVMTGLFKLTTDGLVGIGEGPFKPIFEVGLTIDPVLGLPYYPGSGLKGAVRAYMENELGMNLDVLFGESGEGGHISLVTFLDALPVGCASGCGECSVYTGLITNPHYFKGGKVVNTELEVVPVPITYIGISRCLTFRVTLGVNEDLFEVYRDKIPTKVGKSINSASDLLRVIGMYTVKTLRRGIASKAAKGYNVLEVYEGDLSFNVKSIEFEVEEKSVPHHKPPYTSRKKGGRIWT